MSEEKAVLAACTFKGEPSVIVAHKDWQAAQADIAQQAARIAELEQFVEKWKALAHANQVLAEGAQAINDRNARMRKLEQQRGGVVLPDNLLSHKDSWLAAMRRLVELEPESHAPDQDDRSFWVRELSVMERMYDEVARLNPPGECVAVPLGPLSADNVGAHINAAIKEKLPPVSRLRALLAKQGKENDQ